VAREREVLRTLPVGPVRFTPVNEPNRSGYRFTQPLALDLRPVDRAFRRGESMGGHQRSEDFTGMEPMVAAVPGDTFMKVREEMSPIPPQVIAH
jgi:hypothetical protein